MAVLLEKNAWIRFLKDPAHKVSRRLTAHRASSIFTCSIVQAELFYGAMKYGNVERRKAILVQALAPYESLPFNDNAAIEYGRTRHILELSGQVIGPNDMMIAAIAIVNDLTLVTGNVREFSRIAALKIENWEA